MIDDATIAKHISDGVIDLRDRDKPGWYVRMARRLDGFNSPDRLERAVERAMAQIEAQQATLIDRSLLRLRATPEQIYDKARHARFLGRRHGIATPNADRIVREIGA